ncbi:radical SAM protein [Patescibacteria group bacterium]
MIASYQKLEKKDLEKRAEKAWELLFPCRVCPRKCEVDRIKGEKGDCEMSADLVICSFSAHFGEEAPLVGANGSGTIFFSSCNLGCLYCQNYDISQERTGKRVSMGGLATMMLELQAQDCHNINFVSPSIWVPQILKALTIAQDKGLNIPLVYNSGGYDSVETLQLLDGVVDIYMPDFKYADSKVAEKYSLVQNYFEVAKDAIAEMHKQVGDLVINKDGIAEKGLLVRHLVLPDDLAGTEKVMSFLASLSKDTYVNIMNQYYPTFKARLFNEFSRRITVEEYKKAQKLAKELGLHRFDK